MVSRIMRKHEVISCVTSWRKAQFDWAGKIIQQGLADPDRITKRVLDWKGMNYIHDFAHKNKGWQGHPYRFHAWRWEMEVFNYFRKEGLLFQRHCFQQTDPGRAL